MTSPSIPAPCHVCGAMRGPWWENGRDADGYLTGWPRLCQRCAMLPVPVALGAMSRMEREPTTSRAVLGRMIVRATRSHYQRLARQARRAAGCNQTPGLNFISASCHVSDFASAELGSGRGQADAFYRGGAVRIQSRIAVIVSPSGSASTRIEQSP